jgi:hypothetical protein
MVVVVMLGVGVVVGVLIALIARRWPVLEAPRVAQATVADGVQEHRSLWRHLRRHYQCPMPRLPSVAAAPPLSGPGQ